MDVVLVAFAALSWTEMREGVLLAWKAVLLVDETLDELVRELDDVAVPYNAAGGTVRLSEALESVPQSRFASKAELLDHLHPVFEEYRRSASNNILGQLRALLPF